MSSPLWPVSQAEAARFHDELEELAGEPVRIAGESLRAALERYLDAAIRARLAPCALCGTLHAHKGKFCSDAHRAKYHRERLPAGTVHTIRKLRGGRVSVIVHYSPLEGAIAINYDVGDLVYMGG